VLGRVSRGGAKNVAEEVVVAGGHVVPGVVCREVVGVAVLMADDVVDQLADIPLRARCRPTPVVVRDGG
jgi:hypothetical protein